MQKTESIHRVGGPERTTSTDTVSGKQKTFSFDWRRHQYIGTIMQISATYKIWPK